MRPNASRQLDRSRTHRHVPLIQRTSIVSMLNYLSVLAYPNIDPIAFSIGPLSVHWYGIGYVAGILLAWAYARRLIANSNLWADGKAPLTAQHLDDFIVYAAIGIVLGGRLGYVIAYEPARVLNDPLWIFAIGDGGMSFHGGFLGTTIAMIIFARRNTISVWSMFDIVAATSTIGLFLVRIANFINGELWGRVTDVPWSFVFPTGGPEPRHPSQLYEAGLEGLLLGIILAILVYKASFLKKPGRLTGVFVAGYALSRIFVEFFRQPDAQLGYLAGGWLTMGMLLSLPMLVAGIWAYARATAK